MSRAKLHPFFDSMVTVKDVMAMCYPTPKVHWVQAMLGRGHPVSYVIMTDATKETLKARRKGIENSKKSNIPFAHGKQYN